MKRLACLIAVLACLAAPAAFAAPPDSTCDCHCKPQLATRTIGMAGMAGYTEVPNTCKPPESHLALGKMSDRAACEAACSTDANCSSLEICYPSCAADTDCDSGQACVSGFCGTPPAQTAQAQQAAAAPKEPEFKPVAPALSINIPTLSLPDFTKVTREGNYFYIPFISVYLAAMFRLGIGAGAVLAVIMIMVGGFIWIASAGDSGKIKTAKTMISSAVVGLLLTIFSFVFMQTVNPDLVNLKALKVQIVQPETVDIAEDQAADIVDASQYPTTGTSAAKPDWTATTYICPPDLAKQPPAGVASPSSLISLGCPTGVALGGGDSGGGKGTPAVHDALCKAGAAADAAGYVIRVNSSYRPFQVQANLWCGEGATKYPDANTRKTYYAVPGFSNHGLGNAIDVMLVNKSTGKDLYSFSSSKQCNSSADNVAKIEKFMEDAGFVRYANEIWHFEVGTSGMANRCANCGMPPKCPKS